MDEASGGVKVLSEKTESDDDFLYDGLGPESIPVNVGSLADGCRVLLLMN
jgi:hypothetical protein